MIDYLQRLGASGLATLQTLGRATVLWWQAMTCAPDWRNGPGLLARQRYFVGVYSLLIIVASCLSIGMVLSLQGYNVLVRVCAAGAPGHRVALAVLRALGPGGRVMSAAGGA